MRRRFLLGLGALVGLVLFAASGFLLWRESELGRPVPEPRSAEDRYLSIAKGDSFAAVARRLRAQRWVGSALLLRWEARRSGWDRRIFPGYYRWQRGETVRDLLARLARGEIDEAKVTIPEGWRAERILRVLADSAGVPLDALTRLASDSAWLARHDVPGPGIEGYLLPDTYRIPRGDEPEALLLRMITPGQEYFRDSLAVAAQRANLSAREIWTLASIVEMEAARAEERPQITAVFRNRLRLGMRLESDPTVLYALGRPPGRVLYADLEVVSPYNTYRNVGLPPGPICCPGKASLRAVLHPASGLEALFFVARGDGSHVFSATFAQHRSAIRAIRDRQRRDRATPEGTRVAKPSEP